ncbi:MAG: DMT family transporter [Nanoarchaeota archaeon]|nr:DMT family transporter [Nanoarchaeota archaeon]MBU1643825.1 DMT family transporter [Nanoarchaeota archaeon]MBU1976677.1 DMT family transporter [Nanoarchaeota archaeon]
MDKDKLSYIYVSLAIILWASTAAVGKLIVQEITNIQLMFYSFIFSIMGLFMIVLFQKKLKLFQEYTKKDYLRMAGIGFVGCYLYYIFLFGALMFAPAQEAFIVNYLWPLMVVIFAIIILKEKLTFLKISGILLAIIGVYVVVTQGNILSFSFTNLKADLLAISGAVAYGLFSVLGKKYPYEKYTSMLIYYIFGFVFVLITIFLFSSIPKITYIQLLGIAWLGFATNALAFVFWFKALEYGDTSKMANLVFLTPFLSLVYIYILVGESILISSFIGLVIIVLGIIIQSLRKNKKIKVQSKI